MKCVLLLVFAFVAVAFALPKPDEKYTTKFDNIDIDEILKSDRLFNNYFNCLMDKGKCTPDGTELKRVIPDALATECSKCSEKQKKGAEKVLRHTLENRRGKFDELEKKYDPTGTYRKKYEKEAEKRGIKV